MRIFGTDGIRGKADWLLQNGVARALGCALSTVDFSSANDSVEFEENESKTVDGKERDQTCNYVCEKGRGKISGNGAKAESTKKRIAVAKDVRLSSPAIERQLIEGLLEGGADVRLCGVLPTPALAYVAAEVDADYAVMITASHNPPEYNGLKVMSGRGKLDDKEEKMLDEEVVKKMECERSPKTTSATSIEIFEGAESKYKKHLLDVFSHFGQETKQCKVMLDCAHGCAAELAADVFETLGFDVVCLNGDRDGNLVNVGCGATDLTAFKVERGDVGFSFDGDADRVIAVVDGEPYDGDQILYALAEYYFRCGTLINNAVVGTVLTDSALEKEFAYKGITLHRSAVGDKFVLEKMRETGAVLGGEKSGHTVLGDKTVTGDGIITALTLLQARAALGGLPRFTPTPTFSFNVPSLNPAARFASAEFQARVAAAEEYVGRKGRIIVRPSGTENVIRITVECSSADLEYRKTVESLFFDKNPQK